MLTDVQKLEFLLEKIEWATLLFFAALFILMEVKFVLGDSQTDRQTDMQTERQTD